MENLLKIPYTVFNNDWNLLQQFLVRRGNPRYELLGNVELSWRTDITNLGNLVRIDDNLKIYGTPIQSLGALEYVNGILILNNTPIESLGNLEYVGEYFYLGGTPIKSLGNLKYVGSRIYLSRNHQIPEEQLSKFNINL